MIQQPSPPPAAARWSRRRVLGTVGAAVAGGATVGGLGYVIGRERAQRSPRAGEVHHYRSRPDLTPPVVSVTRHPVGVAAGYALLTPANGAGQHGPMIVDGAGAPVWFQPVTGGRVATNLQVQRYRGSPVLTWWEGAVTVGVGDGDCVIVDSAYREVARLRAGADLHEFALTDRGTALLLVYDRIAADLRPVGGPPDGMLYDPVVREVDVASGRVLFEWHAAQHVSVAESYQPYAGPGQAPPPPRGQGAPGASASASPAPGAALPYDFFHANSIAVDTDGHLLVSARHTSAVYKVHRRSGAVLWRLGGKASDFTMGDRARFSWQHDARRRSDGTLGIFDNGAGTTVDEPRSRGLVLALDDVRRTATLVREYPHPKSLSARSQGSFQELADGGVFVGWGEAGYFSEFTAGGALRFDGHLPDDSFSYRTVRAEWTGEPADLPAVAARSVADGTSVHASWNGASRVTQWRVLGGPQPAELRPLVTAARSGFETTVVVRQSFRYAGVVALDATGTPLATSPTVAVAKAV